MNPMANPTPRSARPQTAPAAPAGQPPARPPRLTLERTFDATPERLWTYWTDPKLYAKWIYPGATDVAMHEFDVRVGGKVRFDMLLDHGDDMPNEGVFHVLDKPRHLQTGSPDKSFLIDVTFEPVGPKRTRMTVAIDGVPADWQEQARQGWSACFEKLQRQLDAPNVPGAGRGKVVERTVHLTRWFRAPPSKVYGAWLDATMLPHFFWPVGTGKVLELDARTGGVIRMGHEQFPDWTATWKLKELVPDRLIRVIDVWPDGSGFEMEGTMEFLPENGGTRMRASFGPFPTTGPFRPEDAMSGSLMAQDRMAELVDTVGPGEGFRLVRHLNAPPEQVFRMWTDKDLLPKWWGASAKQMGFDFRVARLEPRQGGQYDIVMANPEHGELHNHGEYLAFEPGRRLRYRWDFDIFLGPGEKPYPIVVDILFEAVPTWDGKTGTRMTFVQGPMAKPEFTEGSRQGVIQNLGHLEKALSA